MQGILFYSIVSAGIRNRSNVGYYVSGICEFFTLVTRVTQEVPVVKGERL